MKYFFHPHTLLVLIAPLLFYQCESHTSTIPGLKEDVEVIRDKNGINHIYAQSEDDLFFAQGYLAAKDRLFQFEIWRRQATGTLSEILGPREIERDRGVRLFKFRGDKASELAHYHPRGVQIVDAFVAGINTYIEEVRINPELLPVEFELLNIQPEPWTWEVVISRHQGLLANVEEELAISRVVSRVGPEVAKKLYYFHPNEPIIDLDPAIPQELLFKDILAPYEAFRSRVQFEPEDIIPSARGNGYLLTQSGTDDEVQNAKLDRFAQGSNNWVVSGKHTASGYPIMANDPHRSQAVPSLRYWVHLNAPGWNVIGAGEPEIPGVSIGHNDFGAWGLTIFRTDQEDLKIYDLNPNNHEQYLYKGAWIDMKKIEETILVKGQEPVYTTHYYTIHGPVTYIDTELHKVVAVQAAWLLPGGAPYLASLRMDQSTTWEEFRDACTYNHVPAENMVWADLNGNIGWQATGLPPIRRQFSGLVATPGDGRYEWDGLLPIAERPHSYNPESGIIITANQDVSPVGYPYPESLGYQWSDKYRGDRIEEILRNSTDLSPNDMGQIQNDYLALPARALVPYLLELSFEDDLTKESLAYLEDWDYVLNKESIAAGIYVMWERALRKMIDDKMLRPMVHDFVGSVQMTRVQEWMEHPELIFNTEPEFERNQLMKKAFEKAVHDLKHRLGSDITNWKYGQERYKHVYMTHPLGTAVNKSWQEILNLGPLPRGGYSFTPSANSYTDNNTSGASFRIIVDTGDWENTLGINNPGQSGNPDSPFYSNLFKKWADDEYFIVPYNKQAVVSQAKEQLMLLAK